MNISELRDRLDALENFYRDDQLRFAQARDEIINALQQLNKGDNPYSQQMARTKRIDLDHQVEATM